MGTNSQSTQKQYNKVSTDKGTWLHAPGSDFLFAYLKKDWPADLTKKVTQAFEDALEMSSTIKDQVKDTSGDDVKNGLYLLNQSAMTKAMNNIDGMGETEVNQDGKSGSGTTVSINMEFFKAILGGLDGDVAPLMTYLNTQMSDVIAETRKSTVTQNFGTVIGLISVMPVLNVPVTSFQYVFSSAETSQWFVKLICGSTQHYSYDYKYTIVNYNYDKPSK
ncbi:MAG: hypothetical protein VX798_05965 [Bacteroidota bacterium]|nr:hypothetical protein [Bacteroidota bacterium]